MLSPGALFCPSQRKMFDAPRRQNHPSCLVRLLCHTGKDHARRAEGSTPTGASVAPSPLRGTFSRALRSQPGCVAKLQPELRASPPPPPVAADAAPPRHGRRRRPQTGNVGRAAGAGDLRWWQDPWGWRGWCVLLFRSLPSDAAGLPLRPPTRRWPFLTSALLTSLAQMMAPPRRKMVLRRARR